MAWPIIPATLVDVNGSAMGEGTYYRGALPSSPFYVFESKAEMKIDESRAHAFKHPNGVNRQILHFRQSLVSGDINHYYFIFRD